ncbi:MAG TPA: hypothetical protein VFT66_11820 [Roseiflexaceae bacterium]|nr:hypothetical protein [Roseiflexaceae bacterium]
MDVHNKQPSAPPDRPRDRQRRTMRLLLGSVIVLSLVVVALLGVAGVLLARKQPPPVQVIVLTPTPQPAPTRTPTATTVPDTPTPAFTFGAARLADSFDQPDRSHFRAGSNANAQYRFEGGAYTISITNPNYIAWSPARDTFTDGAIEADVTLRQGPSETAAGIVFRYQDAQNFYFFGISGDGYYMLAMLQNGKWTPMLDWTISPAIRGEGQRNRLRVEVAGSRFRVAVNGTLLDESRDATFNQGGIALAVNTFDHGNAIAVFDNVVVYGPQ